MDGDVHLTEAPEARRYELRLDGALVGVADYRDDGDRRALVHVGVEPACRGRGLAGRLTAFALQDIRRRDMAPVPVCSYVSWYLRRHPEAA